MSINSKLATFAQQDLVLARSAPERDSINASLSHLENVLRSKLNIIEFIRFGSYTRNTILPRKYDPRSDVDLMVVFNTTNGIYSSGTYRKYLLDAVSASYPSSISKKDFPAIKLEFNHIIFDLVPAYLEESYWGRKTFYIPDSGNGWQPTVPNDINDDLSAKNQSVGGNIIRQVIRLCKHWNASAGYPLQSYLMEKDILLHWYWSTDNTYDRFLKTLNSIAGNYSGVRQAIDYIRQYEGNYYTEPNYVKQRQWLQKLLPGLQ